MRVPATPRTGCRRDGAAQPAVPLGDPFTADLAAKGGEARRALGDLEPLLRAHLKERRLRGLEHVSDQRLDDVRRHLRERHVLQTIVGEERRLPHRLLHLGARRDAHRALGGTLDERDAELAVTELEEIPLAERATRDDLHAVGETVRAVVIAELQHREQLGVGVARDAETVHRGGTQAKPERHPRA
jgi:hypothetical protein